MEGLFELVSEEILKGAVELVNAYYGSVPLSIAKMLVDGEREPRNEKEKAIILTFQTLKHMFIINYYIETIEEDTYEKAEEVIESLQEDLIKYITYLIHDIIEIQNTKMHEKTVEIAEYIIRGINAYKKIEGNTQALAKIKQKIGEIENQKVRNRILNTLSTTNTS